LSNVLFGRSGGLVFVVDGNDAPVQISETYSKSQQLRRHLLNEHRTHGITQAPSCVTIRKGFALRRGDDSCGSDTTKLKEFPETISGVEVVEAKSVRELVDCSSYEHDWKVRFPDLS
jgi:hypothetical protein